MIVLGDGTKKTAPPHPPPAAELTPEQYAAEGAGGQGEGRPTADDRQVPPAPSAVPAKASAHGRTEMQQTSAQPTVEVAPSGPVPEPTASQLAQSAFVATGAGAEAAGELVERRCHVVEHVGI